MDLCAVIIPFYETCLSKIQLNIIKHNIHCLSKWKIYFTVPNSNKSYAKKIASTLPNVKVLSFDNNYFESIKGYNKLLTSSFFYKQFESYDFILICQTDAVIFSDKLKYWCLKNYSYIGAPWFLGYNKPIKPFKFIGVGNGGLSLRKTKDCLKVLNDHKVMTCFFAYLNTYEFKFQNIYKYSKQFIKFLLKYQIQEDIFWGIGAKLSYSEFRVPSFREAAKFSFELMPSFLYKLNNKNLPFGCHAFAKYEPEFWQSIFKKNKIIL